MSAGGFIAQALLGGTEGAAQGIGNKIREEAKLKRQQALEGTRTENRMQEQAHGSALAIGQQNLQNEYASGEAEKKREHDLALADKQHGQQKDLADYKLTTELTLAREKAEASGSLSDWQNANLDRINGSIDNLQKMERDLMTGKSDGMQISLMGEEGGPEPQNTSDKLAVIRQRLKAEEIKFNRVLGNQRGVDTGMAVLSQAANVTGDEDKQEFLSDLRDSKSYSEDLERQVMQVWGSKDRPSQEVKASEPEQGAAPNPRPQSNEQQPPQQAQQQQPQGGMISQANAAPPPSRSQGPQPTADERPGANPRPPADPNAGKPTMEKKLGPMIEQGMKGVVDAQADYRNSRLDSLAKQLKQAANGNLENKYLDVKMVISRNPEVLRRLNVEDIQRLQEKYGEEFINQFLQ